MTTNGTGTNGTSPNRRVRIAAIQPALALGEVDRNLARCEDLVRQAVKEHNPEVVVLPEAVTSPNVFHPVLRSVPFPVDGVPFLFLRDLARELGVTIGGGYLSVRGPDARHTYGLAEPDGTVHLHDKDEPSAWEYCYYTGGEDDGVFPTRHGVVGCAMGWEGVRSRTAARMVKGGVQLVIGGNCWPAYPRWLSSKILRRDQEYYELWAADAARNLARAVGAPVAMAWHVGPIKGKTPLAPGVPWPTNMVGETSIVERDGHVLARRSWTEGEGYVAAEVEIGPPEPLDPIPSGFWLRPQTTSLHAVWHLMKAHGRLRYRVDKARGRFPWADGSGHDISNTVLPNSLGPSAKKTAPSS